MSLTTDRAALADALSVVQHATNRKATQPVLACVQLSVAADGLRLSATDTEPACVRAVPASGALDPVAVECATLLQIAKALPGDTVTLDLSGTRLVVSAGLSQFKLPVFTDMPPMPAFVAVSAATLAALDLLRLTEQTGFAVADDDVRYGLNGAHVEVDGETLWMVSTDGHRLSRASAPFTGTIAPLGHSLIPRKAIAAVRRILEHAGSVTLEYGEGGWLRLGSFWFRLIDGEFPDYKGILPTETNHRVVIDREALMGAAKRAALIASDRQSRATRFNFTDGSVSVSVSSPERGDVSETLDCDVQNPIELGLNLRYLSEVLAALRTERVVLEVAHALAPMVVKGEGDESAMFLIMPMRLD
jgi:DNA polymerase-3 subunit beta